jgi:hypothetical protein
MPNPALAAGRIHDRVSKRFEKRGLDLNNPKVRARLNRRVSDRVDNRTAMAQGLEAPHQGYLKKNRPKKDGQGGGNNARVMAGSNAQEPNFFSAQQGISPIDVTQMGGKGASPPGGGTRDPLGGKGAPIY